MKKAIAKVLQLNENQVRDSFEQVLNDKSPYITIKVLTITQKGREYKFKDKETEIITTTKEAVISINSFGNNALAVIEKLNTLFYSSTMIGAFNKSNLGLVRVSPIRDLTLNYASGVEQRANLDITCSYINRVTLSQNAIKTAEIGVKVNK